MKFKQSEKIVKYKDFGWGEKLLNIWYLGCQSKFEVQRTISKKSEKVSGREDPWKDEFVKNPVQLRLAGKLKKFLERVTNIWISRHINSLGISLTISERQIIEIGLPWKSALGERKVRQVFFGEEGESKAQWCTHSFFISKFKNCCRFYTNFRYSKIC